MNDVQVGRYAQALHKLLEMSEGAPTPTLAPELFAMLGLEVDRPEWEFLKGGKLCTGYGVEAGAAGVLSIVAMVNPSGSNTLAVIDRIEATSPDTYLKFCLAFHTTFSAFDSDGVSRPIDTRDGIGGLGYARYPTCQILTDQRATISQTVVRIYPKASDRANTYNTFVWDHPIVLIGGCGIGIEPGSVNVQTSATFWWRERVIEKMELQGVNPRLG